MNTYKVYFNDGYSVEVKAVTEWEAEFKAKNQRPSQTVVRVTYLR